MLVNDGVYDKLLGLLSKFSRDEVEIISETPDFVKNQNYLSNEINEILDGKAEFIEMVEAELRLNRIL